MGHHVPGAGRHFGAEDVVLADEEIRVEGSEAPRPGAVRHVGAEDVVLLDEEIRAGEG